MKQREFKEDETWAKINWNKTHSKILLRQRTAQSEARSC